MMLTRKSFCETDGGKGASSVPHSDKQDSWTRARDVDKEAEPLQHSAVYEA